MMLDMRRTFDDMVLAHAGREARRGGPGQPVLPDHLHVVLRHAGVHGDGEAGPARGRGRVGPDRRGHPAEPVRAGLPGRAAAAVHRARRPDDPAAVRRRRARAAGACARSSAPGSALFAKAVSTIVGGQLLADASAFVQAFDSMFGGFRERAQQDLRAAALAAAPAFLVVAAPEPDALREASYFVERLSRRGDAAVPGWWSTGHTPCWPACPPPRALAAADGLERAARRRWPPRCCGCTRTGWRSPSGRSGCSPGSPSAHPGVALVGVPALPTDVHDLDGLREIGAHGWPGRARLSRPRTSSSVRPGVARRPAARSQDVTSGRRRSRRAPLTLGHAAPDTELDPVVQRFGQAFRAHRTREAHELGLALLRTPDEELVRLLVPARSVDAPVPLDSYPPPLSAVQHLKSATPLPGCRRRSNARRLGSCRWTLTDCRAFRFHVQPWVAQPVTCLEYVYSSSVIECYEPCSPDRVPRTLTRVRVRNGVLKLLGLCLLAGVLLAGMLFPVVGALGVVSNRASDTDRQHLRRPGHHRPTVDHDDHGQGRRRRSPTCTTSTGCLTPPDQISPTMKAALISVEDRRFYEHHGVDWKGTIRAAADATRSAGRVAGRVDAHPAVREELPACTWSARNNKVEQQKAQEQTVARKMREARISLQLERKLGKEEILAGYLNVVPFGSTDLRHRAPRRRRTSTPRRTS